MRHCLVLLAALLVVPVLSGADAKLIDEVITHYHEFGTFNGAALVAADGEVVFKKGYGLANREWDIPNTTDTCFRIGSITKQFTAALILQLVDEGKVRLEAPLAEYIEEYPQEVAVRVTVHHLLTHTSGIKSYTGMPKFFGEAYRDPYKPVEFIYFFSSEPLDFEPGERYQYNNSGYFLLGVIIEKVTGRRYAEVLRERILDPLGMRNTGYDTHEALIARRATGYEYRLDGNRNAPYLDMSLPYAAGSMYASAEDLYVWERALADGKVLPAELQAKMFARHVKTAGEDEPKDYGYGWVIETIDHPADEGETIDLVEHGGGIFGFNTLIQRIPEDDHLIVLLNNTPAAHLPDIAAGIREVLYGKTPEPPPAPLSRELYESYEEGGIDRLLARHAEIKEAEAKAYDMSLGELVGLAEHFEGHGRLDEEIAVLELATREHSDQPRAFLRLGDALKRAGRADGAAKAYAQALQLDPKLAPPVADRLRELTKKPD